MKDLSIEIKVQGCENQQEVLDGFNLFSELLSQLPTDLFLNINMGSQKDQLKLSLEDFYVDIVRQYFKKI